jgi:hypothetical protein
VSPGTLRLDTPAVSNGAFVDGPAMLELHKTQYYRALSMAHIGYQSKGDVHKEIVAKIEHVGLLRWFYDFLRP